MRERKKRGGKRAIVLHRSPVQVLKQSAVLVEARLNARLAEFSLNAREMWVLMALHERPFFQGEVADLLNINRNIMVGIVDALEGRDLVTRRRKPDNRRVCLLTLTDRGTRLHDLARSKYREITENIFRPLSFHEIEQVRIKLERMLTEAENGVF